MYRLMGGQAIAGIGHDVWIYDLQEDTHRLDLILDPEHREQFASSPVMYRMSGPCVRPLNGLKRRRFCISRGCRLRLPHQSHSGCHGECHRDAGR